MDMLQYDYFVNFNALSISLLTNTLTSVSRLFADLANSVSIISHQLTSSEMKASPCLTDACFYLLIDFLTC